MKTVPTIACALVLAGLVSTFARSAEDVPFSAELFGVFAFNEQQYNIDDLDGSATLMGPATGMARYFVQGFHAEGTLFLESATGTLVVDYEVDRVEPGVWQGTYVVTDGGSGLFADAGGGGVMDLTFFPELPHAYVLTLDGTVSF